MASLIQYNKLLSHLLDHHHLLLRHRFSGNLHTCYACVRQLLMWKIIQQPMIFYEKDFSRLGIQYRANILQLFELFKLLQTIRSYKQYDSVKKKFPLLNF